MIKILEYKIKYLKSVIFFLVFALPMGVFADSSIKIHVSILPQKYFVEKIGRDKVKVDVLVKPGKSPATYAPSPDQIKKLGMSDIYFKIGVPFENGILNRIKEMDKTNIIDTNKDVVLRDMTQHSHTQKPNHNTHAAGKDPHTWMNPMIVKRQSRTIFQTLSKFDPDSREYYKKNYLKFIKNLDKLDKRLHTILNELKGENLFVFHPFLGYFTDAYGLKQIAIETMGKAPRGKELSRIIKLAKKEKIKRIFVQPQFDKNAANKIASVINGTVISIDPLAYNYLDNMENIAQTIARELKNQ
ncbi:MAG: zinc ABC transporter substrate-binding protein [Deltaproteobacteria bacterium]|nr:zinc ABC transporter substrate-binding protein [Deltaproteobacteria bacterium]